MARYRNPAYSKIRWTTTGFDRILRNQSVRGSWDFRRISGNRRLDGVLTA